ncbi:head GIN domain-containing protein [Polaribacter sp. Asnod1-A03]|uniref:head GIN domain-containing protein n=1 Tax=Polaribacter sp. Asnod1-A03 TaxID=3160581 RepID=UPI0038702320
MKLKLTIFFIFLVSISSNLKAQETIKLNQSFDKIIVSPHIEVVLKKGNEASIVIDDIIVDREKFLYEIEKGTLQVYLEGAKTYTKNKKIIKNNYEQKVPLYNNRVVKLIITYTDVAIFSLRGEEKITFQTPLTQQECTLRIYGKSEVTINTIDVDKLDVSIYGDSFLKIENGKVNQQKLTAYGASKIMAADVASKETKLTAYGDGVFQLNASEKIKVTAYGEATVLYKGNAQLKKGLVIGESTIKRVQ